MAADPFVELLNVVAFTLDRAVDVARRQRQRQNLARDYRNATVKWIDELTAPPPPPAGDETGSDAPPPTAAAPLEESAELPSDWPQRLRKRILNRPFGSLGLTQSVKCFPGVTNAALLDAANRHSWFKVLRAKPGHVLRLADDAKHEPPPAAIIIPAHVPLDPAN